MGEKKMSHTLHLLSVIFSANSPDYIHLTSRKNAALSSFQTQHRFTPSIRSQYGNICAGSADASGRLQQTAVKMWSKTFRRNVRFHIKVCERAPSLRITHLKQTPDNEARVSLIPARYNRLTFTYSRWVDVENHLHRINGCRMTASYNLFHVIPDTDKKKEKRRGGMRLCKCKLPRHLSVSRILLACLPPR